MDEKKPSSGTTDLTTGRPLWRILVFALPLVLGTVFQQLYSFADTVIVGRCLGTDALAAVGSTYSLNFLILGFIQGACVGFGIPVAEAFGAKNRDDLHRYLANGAWLCVAVSVVFTILTTLLAAPLVARWCGPLAAVSIGGATTFDTTLPIITQSAGRPYAVVSVFHGCALDFSVPFLVTFFCTL